MATFITREDRLNASYKKVEALYRKGYDVDSIMNAVRLTRTDVLDIMQKIFAIDMRRLGAM